jgi:hypothetical protein
MELSCTGWLQAEIHNLRDMYLTMRYNDYKHDPLSRCAQCSPPYSACNAIAARNDLNPANGHPSLSYLNVHANESGWLRSWYERKPTWYIRLEGPEMLMGMKVGGLRSWYESD